MKRFSIYFLLMLAACKPAAEQHLPVIRISADHRFFATANGDPFFWLGDTGWLLFIKLNREETDVYLEDRKQKGFNVIQVMLIHDVEKAVNAYGDSALHQQNLAKPDTISTTNYWSHVDYVIDKAAEKGIYLAMVPVWGTNVKKGKVTAEQAKVFCNFLTARYKTKPNIIWLNGGDIKGTDSIHVWRTMGNALRAGDPDHLITFHPRGRSSSSEWFHGEDWLDFNMLQSGHKTYAQDTAAPAIGEDNWKYIQADLAQQPVKPTLDAEPSYEGIPYGLHDTLLPRWNQRDVRRYAYWSVLAGGCGFTYGHNAVMQFYSGTGEGDFGVKEKWSDALQAPGAAQMIHLRDLVLSKPYYERVPDQSLIEGQGERYEYLVASRGRKYAFVYNYTGRRMNIRMGKIAGTEVKTSWFDPRNGKYTEAGNIPNEGIKTFDPPTKEDWVLVLESR